jgi:hypothetical protein
MRWPRRKSNPADDHIVDRGRVWCPTQGRDVDVDSCMICDAFRDLVREDDETILRCRPLPVWAEYRRYPIA